MEKKKLDSVQALRALAYICVFIQHTGISVLGRVGNFGVTVFFILSGFLMILSYFDSDRITGCSVIYNFRFAAGKLKKLYLLHIVMTFVAIPIRAAECEGAYFNLGFIRDLVLNVFLLQSWYPDVNVAFSLNGVAWYLSTCALQYFMFPLIYKRTKTYKNLMQPVLISLLLFAAQALLAFASCYFPWNGMYEGDSFVAWFTYIFPVSRLVDFIIGCNLGYVFLRSRKNLESRKNTLYSLMEIILGCMLLAAFVLFNAGFVKKMEWARVTIWVIPACISVVLFTLKKGIFTRMFTNRFFVYLGNISAVTFLVHQLAIKVVQLLTKDIGGKNYSKNPMVLTAVFLLVIVISQLWISANKIIRLRCAHHGN